MTEPKKAPARKPAATRIPAGAKAPQDRKSAARAEAENDPTVTVAVDGLTVTLERDTLDDYDVLEALASGMYFRACPTMFGEEQWGRIKEHLRDEDGRLRMTAVDEFVHKVFEEAQAGNS